MFKHWLILVSLSLMTLAACGPQAASTPVPPSAAPPTSAPPTDVLTPTSAPSPVPPTPAVPASPVIEHLAAGRPVTIATIHMLNTNNGWATGGPNSTGDHVLFTQDGGATWRDVTPPEPVPAADAPAAAMGYFSDAHTAWVTYSSLTMFKPEAATVWKTTDGGQTWQPSQPLDPGPMGDFFVPSDFYFVDGQTGWLLAHMGVGMMHDYVSMFQTTDGGQAWARVVDAQTSSLWMSCSKTGFAFADLRHGWVTGDCQGVAPGVYLQRTSDGGLTWAAQELPPPATAADLFTRSTTGCGSYSLRFFSAQSGVMVVSCVNFSEYPITREHYLYATQDGGETWTVTGLPAKEASFLTEQQGWAIESPDLNDPAAVRSVYQTTDGGTTWTKIGETHWSGVLDFIDGQAGWVVAKAGDAIALVKTTNGGQSWSEIKPQIAP